MRFERKSSYLIRGVKVEEVVAFAKRRGGLNLVHVYRDPYDGKYKLKVAGVNWGSSKKGRMATSHSANAL